MDKKIRATYYISKKNNKLLKVIAIQKETNPSEIVDELIEQYLKEQSK